MNGADFLKSKGITQTKLAEEMHCTVQNVSLWFSGAVSARVDSIEKITKALGALGVETSYIEVFSVLMRSHEDYKKKVKYRLFPFIW